MILKTKYDLREWIFGRSFKLFSQTLNLQKSGEPTTKSRIPNNPAFVFRMTSPENRRVKQALLRFSKPLSHLVIINIKWHLKGLKQKMLLDFTVRKDLTIWIIVLGGIIFMIGVIQGAYWNHRRIWIQHKNGEIWIAAHTNKNWYGLKREIESNFRRRQI